LSALTARTFKLKDLIAWYDWEGGFEGKMEPFIFPLNVFPILNPVIRIEACDAGIPSNQG
jgi:hypothetical protein